MNSVYDASLLNYEFQTIPSIKLFNAYGIEYEPGIKVHNYYKYCTVLYCFEGEGYVIGDDNCEFSIRKGYIAHVLSECTQYCSVINKQQTKDKNDLCQQFFNKRRE